MSYLNPADITDKTVKDAYDNSPDQMADRMRKVDRRVVRMVQSKGVHPDDIPVDGSGYATTSDVADFALAILYEMVFFDLWGDAEGNTEDIYGMKYTENKRAARKTEQQATAETITNNINADRSAFYTQAPVQ